MSNAVSHHKSNEKKNWKKEQNGNGCLILSFAAGGDDDK